MFETNHRIEYFDNIDRVSFRIVKFMSVTFSSF